MICSGFVTILVLFHIIAYLFICFKGSFLLLTICYSILILILIVISVKFAFKNIEKLKQLFSFRTKSISLCMIVICVLIVMQGFLSSYLYHGDDDDAYFVVASSTVLDAGIVGIDFNTVVTGIEAQGPISRIDTATWEVFIAYCSAISSIEPVVLTHSVLPFLLIFLSYSAVYQNIHLLIGNKEKQRTYFMLSFVLLNLFGGYTIYSPACFLLLRIWQAKAVLVNIIFPILFSNCLELMKEEEEKKGYWIYNSLILLAGVSTTIIAVYLTPIYYMMLGIPFLLSIGWKKAKPLFRYIILSLLPNALFALIAFFKVLEHNKEYMTATPPVWENIFRVNLLSGFYIVLFLMALVFILIKGNKIQKTVLLGIPATLFLTFLNPIFCTVVSQKITGVDVYWRLYWMIPMYYTISYLFSRILFRMSRNWMVDLLSIGMVAFVLNFAGLYMYSFPHFSKHTNRFKLPHSVVKIVDYILENKTHGNKPNIIFPEELAAKARQYSVEVTTPMTRMMYNGAYIIPNIGMRMNDFYFNLYGGNYTDANDLLLKMKALDLDWIIIPSSLDLVNDVRLKLMTEIENYLVYKICD